MHVDITSFGWHVGVTCPPDECVEESEIGLGVDEGCGGAE